mmetsp:Transcript_9335/g.20137  ORF Transcript_9335/g.20137 Transcript_9335/m.20137 type:complete len:574 (+) Transcript_9335:329-2050(+)
MIHPINRWGNGPMAELMRGHHDGSLGRSLSHEELIAALCAHSAPRRPKSACIRASTEKSEPAEKADREKRADKPDAPKRLFKSRSSLGSLKEDYVPHLTSSKQWAQTKKSAGAQFRQPGDVFLLDNDDWHTFKHLEALSLNPHGAEADITCATTDEKTESLRAECPQSAPHGARAGRPLSARVSRCTAVTEKSGLAATSGAARSQDKHREGQHALKSYLRPTASSSSRPASAGALRSATRSQRQSQRAATAAATVAVTVAEKPSGGTATHARPATHELSASAPRSKSEASITSAAPGAATAPARQFGRGPNGVRGMVVAKFTSHLPPSNNLEQPKHQSQYKSRELQQRQRSQLQRQQELLLHTEWCQLQQNHQYQSKKQQDQQDQQQQQLLLQQEQREKRRQQKRHQLQQQELLQQQLQQEQWQTRHEQERWQQRPPPRQQQQPQQPQQPQPQQESQQIQQHAYGQEEQKRSPQKQPQHQNKLQLAREKEAVAATLREAMASNDEQASAVLLRVLERLSSGEDAGAGVTEEERRLEAQMRVLLRRQGDASAETLQRLMARLGAGANRPLHKTQ